jgi:hypothetical protein
MSKPTLAERMDALEAIKTCAQNVADKFESSQAGDEYKWRGGMNDVDALRDALSNLQWLGYSADDPPEPDDEPDYDELEP